LSFATFSKTTIQDGILKIETEQELEICMNSTTSKAELLLGHSMYQEIDFFSILQHFQEQQFKRMF
jgi:hypothetical protein